MPIHVLGIWTPGAARSTDVMPKLLKLARASLLSDAATAMMLGEVKLAGSNGKVSMLSPIELEPPLPAAATLRMPALPAASKASFSSCGNGALPRSLPQLLLLTRMFSPRFLSAVM